MTDTHYDYHLMNYLKKHIVYIADLDMPQQRVFKYPASVRRKVSFIFDRIIYFLYPVSPFPLFTIFL